jgi:hypothetical protein
MKVSDDVRQEWLTLFLLRHRDAFAPIVIQ